MIGANEPHSFQAIANKIIFLAKTCERDPDVLCDQVLKDIRRQPDLARGRRVARRRGSTPRTSD
jgi:hypothetical protein